MVLLLAAGGMLLFSQSRVSSLLKALAGIEAGAEALLSEAAGAGVTIESIETSLSTGEMTIRGLAVRNPEGFRTEHALEAGEVRVAMELATVFKDTVVVREITVEKLLLTYELGPEGSNLEAIRRNAESFAGSDSGVGSGSGSGSDSGPRGDIPAKRLLIENLYVRDGKVAASAVFLEGRSWQVPFPDLHLEHVSFGEGEGGAAAEGIVDEVISTLVRNARESAAPIGERISGGASRAAESAQREIEKRAGSARESLEKGVESARETLEKGTESARNALEAGAESAREALEQGADSAREAVGKGTDEVRKTLEKLLGKRTD